MAVILCCTVVNMHTVYKCYIVKNMRTKFYTVVNMYTMITYTAVNMHTVMTYDAVIMHIVNITLL